MIAFNRGKNALWIGAVCALGVGSVVFVFELLSDTPRAALPTTREAPTLPPGKDVRTGDDFLLPELSALTGEPAEPFDRTLWKAELAAAPGVLISDIPDLESLLRASVSVETHAPDETPFPPHDMSELAHELMAPIVRMMADGEFRIGHPGQEAVFANEDAWSGEAAALAAILRGRGIEPRIVPQLLYLRGQFPALVWRKIVPENCRIRFFVTNAPGQSEELADVFTEELLASIGLHDAFEIEFSIVGEDGLPNSLALAAYRGDDGLFRFSSRLLMRGLKGPQFVSG